MLGQHLRRDPSSDNRIFVYEVTGLQQNDTTQYQDQPIRKSHSQFIQVPFSRMNEEMQRITMLEGEIVSIFPLGKEPSLPDIEDAQPQDQSDEG